MSETTKKPLLILGVYPESEGYPNIKYRLQELHDAQVFSITTLHARIWQHNLPNQNNIGNLITQGWRFVSAHCQVLFAYCKHPYKQRVYIPYPAIFITVLLTWLPKCYRPRHLVIDAFISLYDTVVIDRQLFSKAHLLARLLYSLERHAFKHSDVVIVDTQDNAHYLSGLFNLPASQFFAMPLSTEESGLTAPPYVITEKKPYYTVLFVGTLIPLHGIDVILDAITRLSSKHTINFKIIGNGQRSDLIAHFLQHNPDAFMWIKKWQSSQDILKEVLAADICLGIFGITAKTQRVLPYKLYTYAACGRPIISADTTCIQGYLSDKTHAPFKLIPAGSGAALATAIEELLSQPRLLENYARSAREFYQQQLTNRKALIQFISVLKG